MTRNPGIVTLSDYRPNQPTLICGSGRSGTTAFATWIVNSGHFRFVADEASRDSTLEIKGINEAIARGDAAHLTAFRKKTAKGYAKNFFLKSPLFEIHAEMKPPLKKSWAGANVIILMRDPVAVGSREKSVETPGFILSAHRHVTEAANRLRASIASALKLSETMGVALISYEKMITNSEDIAASFNEWTGNPALTLNAWSQSVRPNSPGYFKKLSEDEFRASGN